MKDFVATTTLAFAVVYLMMKLFLTAQPLQSILHLSLGVLSGKHSTEL